ncbi:phosphatase PAP2 family protein [Nocardioides sp. Kera G14]|uniref:phosphatase PAP2 family protein n=1 Tax=Nocardioides sp. Kera G14 TaxID=2884264 RepID=UPI001D11B77D|nr:phosphatase PAP2 family protein [Nocardioides sp. Kera G14]UDY23836.1 phosphatase PAP2 family protein [Nocardioides sp. Kera G14]
MYRRAQIFLLINAVGIGVAAIIVAIVTGRPLVDPDGSFLGPTWLRLPLLLGGAILLDLLPRTLWLSKFKPTAMWPFAQARLRTHWNRERLTLVVVGILSFYIVYVSYRNLKSALPALITAQYDHELHLIDRAILFGHEPGILLQDVFGTNVMAFLFSYVYLWFLPLVPIAVTCWVVWSKNLAYGYWFVASQTLAWTLGTISYYALPTIGPGLQYPQIYATLAHTPTSDLMDSLVNARHTALWDQQANAAQTVAGFASLHVAITLLVALMVQYTVEYKPLRIAFWINHGFTVCATLYFGWHYISDDVAGVMIALSSFYFGGLVSHQKFRRKGYARREALKMRPDQEVTTV